MGKPNRTNFLVIIGKSAPFEIRQIRGEDDVPHSLVTPIPLETLEEEPEPLLNRDFASEVLSDDEDEDFLPIRYNKASSNTYTSPRSSPVHVYTYNVKNLIFSSLENILDLQQPKILTIDVVSSDCVLGP